MRWTPRRLKLILNIYPPFLFAGIRVTEISPDWRELRVSLRLYWFNRNAVGTHFGGSLYSMADPHVMLLLMQLLGNKYVVWDSSASIEFHKPGIGTVHCVVRITDEDLAEIRMRTESGSPFRPKFTLAVVDEAGDKVATVTKELYVRRKQAAGRGAAEDRYRH
jgi:acyl-coenzyme A thioesterase PaaI-like protein